MAWPPGGHGMGVSHGLTSGRSWPGGLPRPDLRAVMAWRSPTAWPPGGHGARGAG